jgi:hypothetical protein
MVPLRSAITRFGIPALIRDCVPMMLRVRPAQFTTTRVAGSGASAPARMTSSAPGTLVAVGMLIVWYSSNRRASTTTAGAPVQQGREFAGGGGGGACRGRDQLPEGLAGGVDVAEELPAPGHPAGQPARQQ